jgi:hypothetical protein
LQAAEYRERLQFAAEAARDAVATNGASSNGAPAKQPAPAAA